MQGIEMAGEKKTLMDAFVHQKMHSVRIKYTLQIGFVWGSKGAESCSPNIMNHLSVFRTK